MPSLANLPTRRRIFLLAALAVMLVACGGTTKVDDPQLRPIQEMLDAQLPPGTPIGMVNQFVNARGYPVEPGGQPDAMVVMIRHIDQQALKPVTARVTFHFDSNDKLVKTEIVRTFNQNAIPPATQPNSQPEAAQPESQPQTQSEPASPPPQ